MSNGNHFTPGVPLTNTPSFTSSDVDTSSSGLRLANTRGLLFISVTAPTISDSPDWQNLMWCEPTTWNTLQAFNIKMFDPVSESWLLVIAGLPDAAHFPLNSIPVGALQSTLLNVGMVPVVVNDGLGTKVVWQIYMPANIPVANLSPGSANTLLTTNSGGTGVNWTSLASLLSTLGKVVQLSNLTQSGANTGQIIGWNGATWVAVDQYKPPTPAINSDAYNTDANWLEVYSTDTSLTERRTRKNVYDTLIAELSVAAINLTTKISGWANATGTTGAFWFTIQSLQDLISGNILSSILATIAGTYPRKYYTPAYDITDLTTPLAGVNHNLGNTPMIIGCRIICTTGTGVLLTNDDSVNKTIVVGESIDLSTCYVGSPGGAFPGAYHKFTVTADLTKIYLYQTSSDTFPPLLTHSTDLFLSTLSGTFSIQLYALN